MSVGTAMLTLLSISTGESWHMILASLQQPRNLLYQCTKNPTYEDYKANGFEPIGCGIPILSTFYFTTFVLVVCLVFLNLFIAIIL